MDAIKLLLHRGSLGVVDLVDLQDIFIRILIFHLIHDHFCQALGGKFGLIKCKFPYLLLQLVDLTCGRLRARGESSDVCLLLRVHLGLQILRI